MRRSSRRSKRKANLESNMAAVNHGDLFWDIGNFKKTVKRVDDGAVVCDDILRMISERADIEAKYAKKLTAWQDKWGKQVENGPMYATMKNAFSGVLSEAQERAKVHMDCYGKLHNQVIESAKRWKNQAYHKHFMGYWKESKEVDDEFTKAQKPWAEGYNKVQRAKRNYHAACKSCDNASQAFSAASKDENFAPEKVKKLEDNVNKHESNVARTKKKYKEKLQRLQPLTTSYEIEMIKVFDKCQQMEEKKLHFFQDMLVEYHKSINITDDARLNALFRSQLESASSADVKHDLTWWAENHGADMPRNWPRFEAYEINGTDSSFSVATVHMSVLDAELGNFSQEDLQAVTKTASLELQRDPSSSSPELPNPLKKQLHTNRDQSYAAYSEFYRNNRRLERQTAQDIDTLLIESDSSGSVDEDNSYSHVVDKTGPSDFALDGVSGADCSTAIDDSIPVRERYAEQGYFRCFENTENSSGDCSYSAFSEPQNIDVDRFASAVSHSVNEPSQNVVVDPLEAARIMEPGEATPSISDNNIVETAETESQYQVPRRQESNPPPFAAYNGGDNPFASDPGESRSDDEWDDPPPAEDEDMGVPVRALYTYKAVEDDELSFKSGDVFSKLSEEDAQGWCRGRCNGKTGLYPANYVESV